MPDATPAADRLVDWGLALSVGSRVTPPGPSLSRPEIDAVVDDLRARALTAQRHVAAATRLDAGTGVGAVAVIDRPRWIAANLAGFRELLDPLAARLLERRITRTPLLELAGAKATGTETGLLLAFLAGKVLGQYEVFGAHRPGRLLLVAPNIVATERALGADPGDFRLWVCLHEETHRVQMTAVPWLRDHLLGLVGELVESTPLDLGEVIRHVRSAASSAVRSRDLGLLDLIQTPRQREIMSRATAVMSLVEGHAEYVMDAVGPQVIPSVATIRDRFEQKRDSPDPIDRLLRRLLGLDAKLRQYRDGARFVRRVVDLVGLDGFNRVWTSPATLPTPVELHDADAWVARVTA